MTLKLSLSLCLGIAMTTAAWGNPNWKMHNTFDEQITRLIDTGDYVYFTSRTQAYNATQAGNDMDISSLFRYDKEADELLSLSSDNLLTGNVVSRIEYSPEKGMLVVVYSDHDIDLIYDDGKVANIAAYKHATVSSGKDVNSIFIDADADRIYLSTGFGYVALNDKKLEVAESRIYGTDVVGMSRIGDDLLLMTSDRLLAAPVRDPRFSLSEYIKVADLNKAFLIGRLSPEQTLLVDASGNPHTLYKVERKGGALTLTSDLKGRFYNMEHNPAGITLADHQQLLQYKSDGSKEAVARMEQDNGLVAASHDMREVWFGKMRKGICSKRYSAEGDSRWTLTRDFMIPNSPAPFKATSMEWHKDYGMLVANHGYDQNFKGTGVNTPILLSAYKDGMWNNLSPVYTYPDGVASLMDPNGLAIDPDNSDLVYFGSLKFGIERINLKDGSDILHMSRTSDPYRDQPGYVEIVPDQKGEPSPALNGGKSWKSQCMFSAPRFDAYGNMWTAHCDNDDQTPLQTHIFCWEAADRHASADASSFRPMKLLKIEGLPTGNYQFLKTLTSIRNRDYVLWTNASYHGEIVLIDTNGTAADPTDDRIVRMNTFTDQDGSTFDVRYVYDMLEDPQTGYVWVGHGEGVFYFNPTDWAEGKQRVNRIKVARNDGTNLADYLLNQVQVNKIAMDGNGRKWFATTGAGVICTSSDGRTIEEEITTDNSPIPDDIVYGLGYMPTSNSFLFSTEKGIAEYFLTKGSTSGSESSVRAYPNPVRPDYFGYVTIDGIEDGSLVKIADAHGNLVKELGRVSGGEAQWDVTDLSFRRVGSGVYFILVSSGDGMGSSANVGKILVVN